MYVGQSDSAVGILIAICVCGFAESLLDLIFAVLLFLVEINCN